MSTYEVPDPVLDTGVSEMNRKRVLPAKISQFRADLPCTCVLPAALTTPSPQSRPETGPGQATLSTLGCSHLFGLQP